MGTGLWRDGHWVQVRYEDREAIPISKALYEARGYQPPFDNLPTKKDYEAARRIAPSQPGSPPAAPTSRTTGR